MTTITEKLSRIERDIIVVKWMLGLLLAGVASLALNAFLAQG